MNRKHRVDFTSKNQMSGLTHPYHCSHSPSSLFSFTFLTVFTHPDDDYDVDDDDNDDDTASYFR